MTASTLTTVAVFLPIALVGGMVGQLFAPFAITVTVALLASLLVSLTVVPVLAYWFLKAPDLTPEQARAAAGRRRGEGAAQPAAARLPAGAAVRHPRQLVTRADRRGGVRRHDRPGAAAGDQLPRHSGQNTLTHQPEDAGRHRLAATDAAAKKVEDGARRPRRRRDLPGDRRAAAAACWRRRRRRRPGLLLGDARRRTPTRAGASRQLREQARQACPASARSRSAAGRAAAGSPATSSR